MHIIPPFINRELTFDFSTSNESTDQLPNKGIQLCHISYHLNYWQWKCIYCGYKKMAQACVPINLDCRNPSSLTLVPIHLNCYMVETMTYDTNLCFYWRPSVGKFKMIGPELWELYFWGNDWHLRLNLCLRMRNCNLS